MIKLGDKVKDRVSGFKGIAVAKHSYLDGCDRISVQPKINKDGKLPDSSTFDEPQLLIVTRGKVKRMALVADPGGPEKYSDEGRL